MWHAYINIYIGTTASTRSRVTVVKRSNELEWNSYCQLASPKAPLGIIIMQFKQMPQPGLGLQCEPICFLVFTCAIKPTTSTDSLMFRVTGTGGSVCCIGRTLELITEPNISRMFLQFLFPSWYHVTITGAHFTKWRSFFPSQSKFDG